MKRFIYIFIVGNGLACIAGALTAVLVTYFETSHQKDDITIVLEHLSELDLSEH